MVCAFDGRVQAFDAYRANTIAVLPMIECDIHPAEGCDTPLPDQPQAYTSRLIDVCGRRLYQTTTMLGFFRSVDDMRNSSLDSNELRDP